MIKPKRRVYFDNASTTALDPAVLQAMLPYFKEEYGNPSNLYEIGREAKRAIEDSLEKISEVLHCRPDEFIFTGSATEADNLALAGVARANKSNGNKIIISSVEHKGILAVADALKKEGFKIVKLPVGKDGIINLDCLKKELDEKTILVSVTMADSETSTIQPIAKIAKILRQFGKSGLQSDGKSNLQSSILNLQSVGLPYFHTDATQGAAYLNIDVGKLGIDLMTIGAHKLGGPKGIGGLYVRRGVNLNPIILGGGQQGRLRSGTENVPGIVGFAKAMELNEKRKKAGSAKIKRLRDALQKGIFKSIDKVVLNGHPTKRLPNFLSVSILDIEGESLLLELDEHGIMANTGSACNSESLEPSYVLTALGNPYEFIHGSIRFTLGPNNKMSEVNYVLKCLPKIVERLRKISPLNLSIDQKKIISDPRAFVGNQTPHYLRKRSE